jgi:hypothetical protein
VSRRGQCAACVSPVAVPGFTHECGYWQEEVDPLRSACSAVLQEFPVVIPCSAASSLAFTCTSVHFYVIADLVPTHKYSLLPYQNRMQNCLN